jgi:hypothetical protein
MRKRNVRRNEKKTRLQKERVSLPRIIAPQHSPPVGSAACMTKPAIFGLVPRIVGVGLCRGKTVLASFVEYP